MSAGKRAGGISACLEVPSACWEARLVPSWKCLVSAWKLSSAFLLVPGAC